MSDRDEDQRLPLPEGTPFEQANTQAQPQSLNSAVVGTPDTVETSIERNVEVQLAAENKAVLSGSPTAIGVDEDKPMIEKTDAQAQEKASTPEDVRTVVDPTASSDPSAQIQLEAEIEASRSGRLIADGVAKDKLIPLCAVIDYWLAGNTTVLIERLGLVRLAKEVKRDYVLASSLAWRGEYKLACITLRSYIESFCLLLYYFNQGCDRFLYLKGRGYKLMLHRMVQKKSAPDEMHAFRRHYHLLIEEAQQSGGSKFADKFFEEIDDCYDKLSKAVHGDFNPTAGESLSDTFLTLARRVLVVCNTLALHDPMLDSTDDDLKGAMQGILDPYIYTR